MASSAAKARMAMKLVSSSRRMPGCLSSPVSAAKRRWWGAATCCAGSGRMIQAATRLASDSAAAA